MNGVWVCLKRPLNCCCSSRNSGDVHEPVKSQIQRASTPRSGSSRSLSNLRNLMIPSSEFLNASRFDDFVINDSNICKCVESSLTVRCSHVISSSSAFSSDIYTACSCSNQRHGLASLESDICEFGAMACRRCHLKVKDLEAFEAHFLSNHAVSKLVAGDFSRQVVELICNIGSSIISDKTRANIMAILKLHNMQKTIAEFENYRETIKIRSSRLPKKHPRCLADGNEFLGFHGTTLACSLGLNHKKNNIFFTIIEINHILDLHGFSSKTRTDGVNGVLVTSMSVSALECIEMDRSGRSRRIVRALVLCRVIAGRVHKPLKRFEQFSGYSAFDSVAAKMGLNSSIEELYLLSTKALLPCFVIIFKS
ncbi:PREDICTED: uncharacterized protein LOC104818915 [Tarenaya hassleriana]|uniref:uncharacterized protein LOC104818915 n=1 Tax=Tarenaya hassleriana TaxID=28532 RepID=UPI00053C9257|nr:PREDICTED: uncharacterized protein LOC104818915 [Tarenaya hassleriana]